MILALDPYFVFNLDLKGFEKKVYIFLRFERDKIDFRTTILHELFESTEIFSNIFFK